MKIPTQQLRQIIEESQDPPAFMQAVRRVLMPVWRKAHPQRGSRPGPKTPLNMTMVGNAVETVLRGLTPDAFKAVTWREFFIKVQIAVGPSKGGTGELCHKTVLRPLIWTYFLAILEWEDIPPQFFARRQPWMPADKSLPAIKKAFRRERKRPLYRAIRGLKESLGSLEIAQVSFSPKKWKDRGELTITIPSPQEGKWPKWPLFDINSQALHQK